MLGKDRMMASELVAELQRLITQCGDQPVEIEIDSNRQRDKGVLKYDSAYIRHNFIGEYPVSGCKDHFRINAQLRSDRKIVRQKGEEA
tara:strand:- start:273 stop:536 length:264 start_codon:yes stop_codon:yes gene_type:complete